MSIEQAIHERCRTWQPLLELLPRERLVTGWLPPASEGSPVWTEPYVVLERGPQRSATRSSNGGTLVQVLVRFLIQAASLEFALQLATELHACCERQDFTSGDVHVQDMKRTGWRQTPRGDGSWRIMAEYAVRAEE
jgi:hypothetical protein